MPFGPWLASLSGLFRYPPLLKLPRVADRMFPGSVLPGAREGATHHQTFVLFPTLTFLNLRARHYVT